MIPGRLSFVLGLFGVLALMTFLGLRDPMPGRLSDAHRTVEAVGGLRGCRSCHGGEGFEQTCLECHREIGSQLETSRGFHFSLSLEGKRDCAECHAEHLGREFDLVNAVSWERRPPEEFRHEHVEFLLAGKHDDLVCRECHNRRMAGEDWPAARGAQEPRADSYLGLEQACEACHFDLHGEATSDRCEECHDQGSFRPATRFVHERTFPLRGAHAKTSCNPCHRYPADADPAADERAEVVRLPFDRVKGTACESCHETPHVGRNNVMYGANCRSCHDEEKFSSIHYAVERHPARFPLLGSHATVSCAKCHKTETWNLGATGPERCQSCHADPHGPQGRAVRLENTADCARCHLGGNWRVPGFAEQQHARVEFSLEGAHTGVRCAQCHTREKPLPSNSKSDCAVCHTDPHRSRFDLACLACHRLEDPKWDRSRLRFPAQAHDRTEFPLDAVHAEVDCARCHGGTASFRERFPGRDVGQCAVCHPDPHGGQFASRAESCASCHRGPKFLPATFSPEDHEAYPLVGGHLAVSCVRCHEKEEGTGIRRFVGISRKCAACHENPHGVQFDREIMTSGCEGCHATSDSWRTRPFDHRVTGYLLEGAHATADCAECHRPFEPGAPAPFRGTPRECRACHADPHLGQLTDPGSPSCGRCHEAFDRWSAEGFDHDTDSRYRPDGIHRKVQCAGCHAESVAPNGKTYVHYKPLGMECRDCHAIR